MKFTIYPKLLGLSIVFLLMSLSASAQKTYTISGYVQDLASGEKMIGANVFDPKSDKGTSTNTYGFYSLTLPKDSVYLAVSYIGYQTKYFKFFLDKDVTMNFELSEGQELETLEIVGEETKRIEETTQMGQMTIPVQQIKSLPALLGETDVLKALQLLPGVQSGGEGTSGLYVRGGSPDQNLILLDGVPVYNASHLFGFFSVFNADAIKNVTLTKGGFPARYGGRLSSVLEINMKEGNMKEFHGEGSIGTIFSKLTLEGPIIKDRTSFIVSARRTYIDILASPIVQSGFRESGIDGDLDLYFYDLNLKINHKLTDKDRLYLSFYLGDDIFGIETTDEGSDYSDKLSAGIDWGNITGAARWNRAWNSKLFSNTALTYSNYSLNNRVGFETIYDTGSQIDTTAAGFKYQSGIKDYAFKTDFEYVPNPDHYVRFGAGIIHHTFSPGAAEFNLQQDVFDFDTIVGNDQVKTYELSLYVEDDWDITPNLKANIGLHASAFSVDGKTYSSLQPRAGVRYLLPKDFALKGSFAMMTQYLHLLSNEGVGLPTDLWVPTTKNIIPEQSWQASLGIAKTFSKGIEFSIEGYYKDMKNLVSYKEGASFLDGVFGGSGSNWEDQITQGIGRSYGLELFLQKKTGRTTGWIGYTLSYTDRQFDEINGGKRYPFKYDRRHDISIVLSHEFSEKWSASAVWVYGTGNSITLPVSKHQPYVYTGGEPYNLEPFQQYWDVTERASDKNAYRMGDYHRLDISVEYKKSRMILKDRVKWESTWAFGAYNAYSRANPFFVNRDRVFNGGAPKEVFRQYSLFPIIPFVSYRFKF